MKHSELVVMLTYRDYTVTDAYGIMKACKNTKAGCWGFKELPLPLERMKDLSRLLRSYGKTVFLEVVAYTEEACLEGAEKAVKCGVDYLIGTTYFDSVNELCNANGIRYMPYVGKVTGRPSVLSGTAERIILEAQKYMEKGVYGVNLLGYRYSGNAEALVRRVLPAMHGYGIPVCLTGGINSFRQLDVIMNTAPEFFTVGSAFFDNRFGDTMAEQIDIVCEYLKGEAAMEVGRDQ